MSLARELKTTFKDERLKLGVNIVYTSKWYEAHLVDMLKPEDITLAQYNVLRILRNAYPLALSVKEIRIQMLDKMSDVSRIIDKLSKKNWILRHKNKDDKRNLDVKISFEGLQLLSNIDEKTKKLVNIFAALSAQEVDQLNMLLDKLRNKFVPKSS